MPTTRRSSSGRGPATGKQSKLSFNNRVTKPSAKSAKDKVAPSPLKKELIQEHIESQKEESVEPEQQIQQEAESEQTTGTPVSAKSDAEIKAAKLSDAAITKYWRKVEAERMSKRVHQEELSLGEKVLRYFDVSSHYGPSIGLTRMRRWQRAQRLGLNPPIEVLAVLLKEEANGNHDIEKAHIDRIMNSTAIGAA
ncbi:DNA polymerase delta, subunit 4-domain-containing protein [Coniochaeta sp. 2T2.1]|nr:DNA polymerase delta, subunit 4-domain-containing protein [Coniochaeta sp. 2T2.1]